MHILVGNKWCEGYLDPHRSEGELRIQALLWLVLDRVEGLYFVRQRSLRTLWNYATGLGVREVIRKVISRLRERPRNEKFVSCGLGRVVEADDSSIVGSYVYFLAACQPRCCERVVVSDRLCAPAARGSVDRGLLLTDQSAMASTDRWWDPLCEWEPASGAPMPESTVILGRVKEHIARCKWSQARFLPVNDSPVAERRPRESASKTSNPRATLFGYGNYAKTVTLPNMKRHLEVTCIHELDPTQIPLRNKRVGWDTSPTLGVDEEFDVLLIAGYHHTHASLAMEALCRGRYAVVEKPVVTTESQLAILLTAMRKHQKLFACFQRRYLPFNDYIRYDLQTAPGDPISYHAIVYEVPLPPRHWYRWPSSRNRLIANGCHWVDHFLFLNEYASVRSSEVARARDGTVNCSVELENRALFTMVLTEKGSDRIGVQDYVELRANGATARVSNASRYEAEGKNRILRTTRIRKMRSYQLMYDTIGRKVLAGQPGDSLRSVEVGSSLTLLLADQFDAIQN